MPISHLFLLRRTLSTNKPTKFTICSLFLGPIFSKWAALLKRYNDFPCSTKLRCHIDYTQRYTKHKMGRGGRELSKTQLYFSRHKSRLITETETEAETKTLKTKAAAKQPFTVHRSNLYIIAIWWPVCSVDSIPFHSVSFHFVFISISTCRVYQQLSFQS